MIGICNTGIQILYGSVVSPEPPYFDADPDKTFYLCPAFYFDTNPDLGFLFYADPDPAFQNDADP